MKTSPELDAIRKKKASCGHMAWNIAKGKMRCAEMTCKNYIGRWWR